MPGERASHPPLHDAIQRVSSVLAEVKGMLPGVAGASLKQSETSEGLTALLVDEQGLAEPLLSVWLGDLSLPARATVARLAHTMLACMQADLMDSDQDHGSGRYFMRDDSGALPEVMAMGDYRHALLALGPGEWTDAEGPTTGVGTEFWFVDESAAKQAYVCIDQGECTACEVTDLDASEADADTQQQSGQAPATPASLPAPSTPHQMDLVLQLSTIEGYRHPLLGARLAVDEAFLRELEAKAAMARQNDLSELRQFFYGTDYLFSRDATEGETGAPAAPELCHSKSEVWLAGSVGRDGIHVESMPVQVQRLREAFDSGVKLFVQADQCKPLDFVHACDLDGELEALTLELDAVVIGADGELRAESDRQRRWREET